MENIKDSSSIEQVLLAAAKQINQQSKSFGHKRKVKITQEILSEVAEYLISDEWFETAGDLRAALEDGDAWEWLKLPGALKLQMKKVLVHQPLPPPPPPVSGASARNVWSQQWDPETSAYYYMNSTTGESTWDPPPGFDMVQGDDLSNGPESLSALSPAKDKVADTSVFSLLEADSDEDGNTEGLVDATSVEPNEEKVRQLVEMGFPEDKSRVILVECLNNLQDAVSKLMNTSF